jgi:hypothetical protein
MKFVRAILFKRVPLRKNPFFDEVKLYGVKNMGFEVDDPFSGIIHVSVTFFVVVSLQSHFLNSYIGCYLVVMFDGS